MPAKALADPRLLILAVLISLSPMASAQLTGQIAERPFAVGFARNISEERAISYIKGLSDRLAISETIADDLPTEEELRARSSSVDDPISGVAWYMVTGLLPSFEYVTFRQVTDEEEARRILQAEAKNYGEGAFVTEEPPGMFQLGRSWNGRYPLAHGQTETDVLGQPSETRGFSRTTKVVEENGGKFVDMVQTWTTLYRYHDGILFSADFKELWTMTLPTSDVLLTGVDGARDLGVGAYFDRIPQGIKLLGWNMLNSGIGSQIQQRDDEDVTSYDVRRSAGDLGLNALRSVLFDVDKAEGWLQFADDNTPSVRGSLIIKARNNSQLAKDFQTTVGLSRFAPVVPDNAAATVHLCLRLPDEAPRTLEAVGTWLKSAMAKDFPGSDVMTTAGVHLAETLSEIGQQRTLEVLLKIGWTEASDGVIYGGIQVGNNSELLKTLHQLMTQTPGLPKEVTEAIALIDREGQPMIQVTPPEQAVRELNDSMGLQITRIYLVHRNSCLWFALGGEKAVQILDQSIARCEAGGFASRTPLLQARVDAELWLSYPQDDPVGIASLLTRMDETSHVFPPGPVSFEMIGQQLDKPMPLLKRVFELGGDRDASLRVDADESGLALHIELGEAIAHYYAARMIDSQNKLQASHRKEAEAHRQRAEERRLEVEKQKNSESSAQ